mmetsp:Transcript_10498/g.25960  ORF Transcript_10498/g.25960 Transcript_10498/m.25960 type:complete len:102 (-) Transcript_10498:260-565(-)
MARDWADFCRKNVKGLPRGNDSGQGMARRLREVAQAVIKTLQMPQPSKLAQNEIDVASHTIVDGVASPSVGKLQGGGKGAAVIVGSDLVTPTKNKGQSAWA